MKITYVLDEKYLCFEKETLVFFLIMPNFSENSCMCPL